MNEKSLDLGTIAAALAMSVANRGMHLHPWNPKYLDNKSNRKDKKTAKQSMSTKERVEARKMGKKPNA